MPLSKYDAYDANVKIVATKRIKNNTNRIDLGKILKINKIRKIIAAINNKKAIIERPDVADEQPLQYKPPPKDVQFGVAKEITQNRADTAVITAVIISNIFSVICMV